MSIDLVEKQKAIIKISQTNRKSQDAQTAGTERQARALPLLPAAALGSSARAPTGAATAPDAWSSDYGAGPGSTLSLPRVMSG